MGEIILGAIFLGLFLFATANKDIEYTDEQKQFLKKHPIFAFFNFLLMRSNVRSIK